MTTAAPSLLGYDVLVDAITEDADALFTGGTGLAVVKQDVRHRLLTDTVLGPGGEDWGFDVRKLAGAPDSTVTSLLPTIRNVVLKDMRVKTATVTMTTSGTPPMRGVALVVNAVTGAGPFRLVFPLDNSQTTAALVAAIEAQ